MSKRSNLLQSSSTLARDRGGNFSLMAALVIPVLFASGGVAIDMTSMMMAKNQLQDVTDAAALAASSALVNDGLTIEQAKTLAKDFVKGQMKSYSNLPADELLALEQALASNTAVDIEEQKSALGNAKTYVVDVSASFSMPLNGLTRLLGRESADIGTKSKSLSSTEAKNALSMYLVLDQSGSMADNTSTVNATTPTKSYDCSYYSGWKHITKTCTEPNYITKIEALRTASANLLTQLQTADSTKSLVRTGVSSYSTTLVKSVSLDWGVTAVKDYVETLPATGYTDSSGAIAAGYKALSAAAETTAHKNKNGQSPKKFIVFMTDGENNYYKNKANDTGSDTATKKTCDQARTDGMEVYTVAFMAPDRGQKLLKYCATTANHYFAAENAADLTAAFKYIGEKASEMTVRLTQ